MTKTCPACAGEVVARKLLLQALCEKHRVQIAPIPEEILLAAILTGSRAKKARVCFTLPDGGRYR